MPSIVSARPRRRSRALVSALMAVSCSAAAGLVSAAAVPAEAAVPTGWSEIAHDSFSRTTSSGWGSAEAGGAYTLSGAAASGTGGGAGSVNLATGHQFSATLASVSAGDVNLSDAAKITAGSVYDVLHGWKVRNQSNGNGYTFRVRLNETGKTSLGVSRTVGADTTWLTGTNLPTMRSGQTLRGEVQVSGTSPVLIKARAWVDGTTTPAWQIEYSDSSAARIQTKGSVQVWDYVQAANTAVSAVRDNISVGATAANQTTRATPPAVPAPAPIPTGSRGSAAVGSASYSAPSGAVFVDAARGSDANAGSQNSPLRTVAAALNKVPTGGTVVLRGGTYHESVASTRTVTVQNYPGEAVWFDGSVPISTWTRSGSVWVSSGWNAEFPSSMGGDAAFKARFIGSNPMAADPDQAFVNGAALRQVASGSAVGTGQFSVNDAANTITIGTEPTGKEVRASNLSRAIALSGTNSVIQGIGVRRYANAYEIGGAVRLGNVGGTLRNVVIQDVATIGVSMSNINKTVDHVTVQRAGQMGIGGHQNDNSSITNSSVSNNNTENFKDAPVAGGIKLTASRTVTVKNVDASNNVGSGIWFDVSSYNLTIVNNTANGNTKHGIEVEVSDKGIIANNVATNGGEDGIILFDSGNFKVFNNDVGGSLLFGIKLAQDERRQAILGSFSEARDSRVSGVDANVPWITRNIQVSNNAFGHKGYFQLYALDGKTGRAVDTWNLTVTGNLFNKRAAGSDPTMVAWGKGDKHTLERYETPAALASAKNGGWANAQLTSSKSINSMGADKTAFASLAVPLPSDVASATGLPTGAKVMGAH